MVALAFLCAWSIQVTTLLTWIYGPDQFATVLLGIPRGLLRFRLALFSTLAAPLAIMAVARSPLSMWKSILAALAGALAALALVACAALFRQMIVRPHESPDEYVSLLFHRGDWIPNLLRDSNLPKVLGITFLEGWLDPLLARGLIRLGPGYVDWRYCRANL